MSAVRKIICAVVVLLAVGMPAVADDLGFTVGLDVSFGDVLSALELGITPWVEWSHTLAVLDLTLHAEYTKSFAAGAGVGSAMFSEEVSYTIGEDFSITPTLYNENTVSFEGAAFAGYLEPYVDISAGMFYATVGLPMDYLPSFSLAAYATAGISGDTWAADATLDVTITGGFSFDDVVLYGELTLSPATLCVSATVPFDFTSVTLSPEVDLSIGSFELDVGADLGLSTSAAMTLSPWVSASFSF